MELLTVSNRARTAGNMVFAYSGAITDSYWQMFFKVDPTQLQSWLQENEYIFQDSVNLYNADLAKLG